MITRRLSLRLAAVGLAAACTLQAGLSLAEATEPRAINWEELVPAGWDPASEFVDLFENTGEDWDGWEDTDPRAQELYERMRKIWDAAPTINGFDGQTVRLPGYVVALEEGRDGLTELLLVPNFGACIHTPPPPANQIIHIKLDRPIKGIHSLDAVWATGELIVTRNDSEMGVSGYSLKSASIEEYRL